MVAEWLRLRTPVPKFPRSITTAQPTGWYSRGQFLRRRVAKVVHTKAPSLNSLTRRHQPMGYGGATQNLFQQLASSMWHAIKWQRAFSNSFAHQSNDAPFTSPVIVITWYLCLCRLQVQLRLLGRFLWHQGGRRVGISSVQAFYQRQPHLHVYPGQHVCVHAVPHVRHTGKQLRLTVFCTLFACLASSISENIFDICFFISVVSRHCQIIARVSSCLYLVCFTDKHLHV